MSAHGGPGDVGAGRANGDVRPCACAARRRAGQAAGRFRKLVEGGLWWQWLGRWRTTTHVLDDTTSANAGRRGRHRRLTAAAQLPNTNSDIADCTSAMALPVPTVAPKSTLSVAITSLGSGDQPHGGGDVVRHGREGARRDVLHQR